MYPYCSITIKFISKTDFEKVYLWNLLFFPCKSWSELTGRCKLRLRWLFLDWWKYFLGFPVILGETRIRILEFGGHLTEFGRAWKARTQNWRKSMFSTWIMNKSVCVSFLGDMRLYNNFTSHIWPSPEIWFETGHFEFLSFRAPGSVSGMFTNWDWNHSRGKIKWNFTNW